MPFLASALPWLESARRRDFALFFAARGLVAFAAQVQTVAIGWQVYDMTGDVMALGYVGLALFLPVVICTLPAGDAADRFDRRRIIALSYVVQAGCAALLAAFAIAGITETLPV
jgi:MFS family permease